MTITQKQYEQNYEQLQRHRKHEKDLKEWAKDFPFDPLKQKITGKDWRKYKQARKKASDQLKSLNSV
mgnify:CR=1 FL=1|tara:strand:- start:1903 stop:2103 length:201 start_codon:yes stop_codon:yes gene_type:complete